MARAVTHDMVARAIKLRYHESPKHSGSDADALRIKVLRLGLSKVCASRYLTSFLHLNGCDRKLVKVAHVLPS